MVFLMVLVAMVTNCILIFFLQWYEMHTNANLKSQRHIFSQTNIFFSNQ